MRKRANSSKMHYMLIQANACLWHWYLPCCIFRYTYLVIEQNKLVNSCVQHESEWRAYPDLVYGMRLFRRPEQYV